LSTGVNVGSVRTVHSRLLSALAQVARLDVATPRERVESAAAVEAEHVVGELRRAVGRIPDHERLSAGFRAVAARLELRPHRDLTAVELEDGIASAGAEGSARLELALRDGLARLRQLEARVEWLLRGTTALQLEALDPEQDSDRIYHHLLSSFRAESRVVETLAINRVSTWRSLALFLRSTRESERNPVGRFFDTYALFANFFEWGEHSQRGSEAVRRINQIHGRYYLPNEGMKYVLLNTAFTWLDGIDRIGHRPLSERERRGFFHAHVRLGRAMHIQDLSDDYAEMYAWFSRINRDNAFHTALKTETFETFVGNSFDSAAPERTALLLAARVAMDDHYRAALGYAAPSAEETASVRQALGSLASTETSRARAPWLRSLERTPLRPLPCAPGELGVSERSAALPRLDPAAPNGGYPERQLPLREAHAAEHVELPTYDWAEIRRHATSSSTWLVIDGDVYDVSGWLEQHPGGAERLRQWAGRDATGAFEEAGHSPLTRILRLNYRIGRVRAGE